jgi:hypothetical protein
MKQSTTAEEEGGTMKTHPFDALRRARRAMGRAHRAQTKAIQAIADVLGVGRSYVHPDGFGEGFVVLCRSQKEAKALISKLKAEQCKADRFGSEVRVTL